MPVDVPFAGVDDGEAQIGWPHRNRMEDCDWIWDVGGAASPLHAVHAA